MLLAGFIRLPNSGRRAPLPAGAGPATEGGADMNAGSIGRRLPWGRFVVAVAALAAVAALLALWPPQPASAHTYVDLLCGPGLVWEGGPKRATARGHLDSYRLAEDDRYIRWYTDTGTADESDYPRVWGLEQRVGSRAGDLFGKDRWFQTTQDPYPELDETFTIRMEINDNESDRTSCTITILNNDGVGIHDLEIISSPADGLAYRAGERIEIVARFNAEVSVSKPVMLPLRMGFNYDVTREASLEGEYTDNGEQNSYLFAYEVQPGDAAFDGLSVDDGFIDYDGTTHSLTGSGSITASDTGDPISPWYRGLDADPNHRVSGFAYVTGVRITSTPAIGDTYGRGETIQVTVDFNSPVDVTGNLSPSSPGRGDVSLYLIMETGQGGLRRADYVSGSGTDSLVFEYEVTARNLYKREFDSDGIGIGIELPDEVYELFFIREEGSIVSAGSDVDADTYWPPTTSAPGHLVDGYLGARIASFEVTSNPGSDNTYGVGDRITVKVSFSAAVSATGSPQLMLDFDGAAKTAQRSGSQGNDVYFSYTVEVGDRAGNGIAIGADALALNGGSIEDSWGAAAGLSHAAMPADPNHRVSAPGGL